MQLKVIKKFLVYFFASIFIAFFLASNTILNNFFPHSYPYRFCSDQCKFDALELGKGHDPLRRVEIGFAEYKILHNKKNLVLHRRFYRKWWQIWNWIDFITHPRWSYPYAENDADT